MQQIYARACFCTSCLSCSLGSHWTRIRNTSPSTVDLRLTESLKHYVSSEQCFRSLHLLISVGLWASLRYQSILPAERTFCECWTETWKKNKPKLTFVSSAVMVLGHLKYQQDYILHLERRNSSVCVFQIESSTANISGPLRLRSPCFPC